MKGALIGIEIAQNRRKAI